MISRWPVLVTLPVEADDCDGEGRLTDAAVGRLFAQARTSYFALCTTVDESTLEVQQTTVQLGSPVTTGGVSVSVNVVEVFPETFTMTARFRADGAGDDSIAATGWCSLSPGGPVSTAMRDEFIALAHDARHFH